MCFIVDAYFSRNANLAYRSDFRKFDGEIYKKRPACQKTFSTARRMFFFPRHEKFNV